jgi:hypothetical protein
MTETLGNITDSEDAAAGVQHAVQPDARFSVPSVPVAPPRDEKTGRFLPGNFAASQHALRTDRLPPEFEHLAAELAEFAGQSIADDGGAEAISARRRSLHNYRARVHRRIAQLDAAIELRGLFDKRGKLRVAWLQQLQGLIRTAQGIDSLLGLERRSKAVAGQSLQAFLANPDAGDESEPA